VKYIILAVLTLVAGCTTGTHKATNVIGRAITKANQNSLTRMRNSEPYIGF
jgi:hypothetical protein